jgi:hypothetical protein
LHLVCESIRSTSLDNPQMRSFVLLSQPTVHVQRQNERVSCPGGVARHKDCNRTRGYRLMPYVPQGACYIYRGIALWSPTLLRKPLPENSVLVHLHLPLGTQPQVRLNLRPGFPLQTLQVFRR